MRLFFKGNTLLLIAILSTNAVRSQDLLTPSNYNPHFLDYEQAIQDILLSYYSRPHNGNIGYDAYFLCNPSFGPNYSLAIRESRNIGTDSLILTRATRNIWYEGAYSWADKKMRKGVKKISVERYSMPIKKDFTNKITQTFCSAVMTSSHFADSRMGCDGVTYKFYTSGIMAEVWTPEKDSRTYRLVNMADSLCIAVEHGDTAIIRRQMPICQQLTKEFRECYPQSALTSYPNTTDTTLGYTIFHNHFSPILDLTFPKEHEMRNNEHLTDTLLLWARELFVNCYDYRVSLYITDSVALCEFHHYQYTNTVNIYIPTCLFKHDFIFNALKLPFDTYRLNEKDEWEKQK